MRQRSPKPLWAHVSWVTAALCVWALAVMERALERRATPLRALLIVTSCFVACGAANWAAGRLRRTRWRYLPLLVLAGIGARELHRQVLRRQYRTGAPVRSIGPAESIWHPVTTTDLVVRYHTLTSHELAVPRLRILELSDLHVSPALPAEYYERVFDVAIAQDPDLILLTGDYVSKSENIAFMARLFAKPLHARFGVFAVLGNHDHWSGAATIRQILAAAGVTLITGRCEHLPEAVGRVAICGTEAPWGPDLSATLDKKDLNLVLSHTPDNVYRLGAEGASVVFSGHTHGGQIRVPGVGALVVPSRFGRVFDEGHFRVAGTDLFVTAGVGADFPPLRIYCPPEVLVVDITRH
jgi:predicted MPP superfamily phosphohydrolase